MRDNSNVSVGTATGGGLTGTLILVDVPVASSLRYFTIQEFLDFYNLNEYSTDRENGVKPQQIILFGTAVEKRIDEEINSKCDSNGGAYYTVTQEYHDSRYSRQADYFTKLAPIVSMTTFQVDLAADENTANWSTLTEANSEISVDLETGRVHIKDSRNYAETGKRHVRITYKYGRATVPYDIKLLAIQETGIMMQGASFLRSRILDKGTNEMPSLESFMRYRKEVIDDYRNPPIYRV